MYQSDVNGDKDVRQIGWLVGRLVWFSLSLVHGYMCRMEACTNE